MNILHLNDMAGVAFTLAGLQQRAGHRAEVVRFENLGPVTWNAKAILNSDRLRGADIIHIHGGLRASQLALLSYREKLVAHFHGSDARNGEALHHLPPNRIVSTPDLLAQVPDARWIPNPLAVPFRELPYTENGPVLVGHFPSNFAQKGTALIQETVETMVTADLLVVHGAAHDVALAAMEKCDIIIDQLTPWGVYGTVTLEALAMGKPVICSLDPSLYPEMPPIVAVDPRNLTVEALRWAIWDLIETRADWPSWRHRGRTYLESVHDGAAIQRTLQRVYEELLEALA